MHRPLPTTTHLLASRFGLEGRPGRRAATRTSNHAPTRVFSLALAVAVLAGVGAGCTSRDLPRGTNRAILVSVDALNEAILRARLTPEQAPNLYRIFNEGRCADHAVTAFPSVTASAHSVLWTGAYGNVTGVTANQMHTLPRDRNTVMTRTNGFNYVALRGEPIWITAARAGIPITGHHVTQAPFPGGFEALEGERTAELTRRRDEQFALLQRPDVNVMNGYNRMVEGTRILTPSGVQVDDVEGWVGLETLDSGMVPRGIRWDTGAGTIHGVFHGSDRYEALTVSHTREVANSVTARLAPVETTPPAGRDLARHFSPSLEIPVDDGRVHLRIRVFELAPDASDFLVVQPSLDVNEGNREDLMLAHDAATGGWVNNHVLGAYLLGGLGAQRFAGGDGTAEQRHLELVELVTRQIMAGSEWLWRTYSPRLHLDYNPISDAIDHNLLGYLDPASPAYNPEVAPYLEAFRAEVWGYVDLFVGHLLALAEEEGAALFISGDHGMRASWKQFLPNVALAQAGLLVVGDDGQIDLSRSRAVSPNGYWVSVNRTAWRDGIVPPEEEAAVIEAVRRALEGVRDRDGIRVVSRTFTPAEDPWTGIGGPTGGDVYWSTAPGYRSLSGWRGTEAAGETSVTAGHGFPSDEPDMYTAFCAIGGGFTPGRIPSVRTTVIAPTIAEYTGIPRPLDAVGVSVLQVLREGDPLEAALVRRIAQEGDSIQIGISIWDVDSERRIEIGSDRVFHAASTMKVPVLQELMRRAEAGDIDLDAPFPVTNTFRSILDGSPFTLDDDVDEGLVAALGGTLPLRRIAEGVIQLSSNLGTNLLLELLTPDSVRSTMARIGAEEMQVLRGVSDIPAFEAGMSNRTSARGFRRSLEALVRCELWTRESCAEMNRILEGQTFRTEIPAGIPASAYANGVRVGNKTGSITRILHDGAIVRQEGRGPYVLVILTEGYLDKEAGAQAMADLSRIVWEGLRGR
jgi:beta-lactamase class A